MRWVFPLVVLAACAGTSTEMSDAREAPPEIPESAGDDALNGLRIDVFPGNIRADSGDGFRVLPQTLEPLNLARDTILDLGSIELIRPKLQTGSVQGFALNPQVASLPGSVVPVQGTVLIGREGTVQSYASSLLAGQFETWLVPRNPYRLTVIPDDPLLPMFSKDLATGASTRPENIDIGLGVPVFGKIRTTAGPVPGARVVVVDADGNRSSTAVADQDGLYQIRVQEGTFSVVCEGREFGQDPVLTVAEVDVGPSGANVDFDYPNSLSQAFVEGRVQSAAGEPVAGTLVRFVAESLDGYAGLDASWTWEAGIDPQGTFIAKITPGTYTIEVLPPAVDAGTDHTPVRLQGERIGAQGADLGLLQMPRTTTLAGTVVSPGGEALADSVLDCTEIGFDGRSWFATTAYDGTFALEVPRIPLECVVAPPGTRDLASGRFVIDPATATLPVLALRAGTEIRGRVFSEEGPEALAVVEVRGSGDRLLGYGLTDDDGEYLIRVDLEVGDDPETP